MVKHVAISLVDTGANIVSDIIGQFESISNLKRKLQDETKIRRMIERSVDNINQGTKTFKNEPTIFWEGHAMIFLPSLQSGCHLVMDINMESKHIYSNQR